MHRESSSDSDKLYDIVISNAVYYRCMHRESSSDSDKLYDRNLLAGNKAMMVN